MFNIYRNSALTLAATSPKSGDSRVFSKRPVGVVAKAAIICALKPTEDSDDSSGYDAEMLVFQIELDPDDPTIL